MPRTGTGLSRVHRPRRLVRDRRAGLSTWQPQLLGDRVLRARSAHARDRGGKVGNVGASREARPGSSVRLTRASPTQHESGDDQAEREDRAK